MRKNNTMSVYEKFKDVPHFELLTENGECHIPSVFMFRGGCQELFPFLAAAEAMGCTVIFDNEAMEVDPRNKDFLLSFRLAWYVQTAESPKIVEDYMRYLLRIDEMTWDKRISTANN